MRTAINIFRININLVAKTITERVGKPIFYIGEIATQPFTIGYLTNNKQQITNNKQQKIPRISIQEMN